MLFFFKKKEIVLDCFTTVPHVYEYAKIEKAIKYIPEWWKNTPKTLADNTPTIKNCVGLIDFYKKGIVIPSWFEMDLTVFKDNSETWFEWAASNNDLNTAESHQPEMFSSFADKNGKNIKITSPWMLKTKEEVYFTWTEPTWNIRSLVTKISVLPAVINFKYQHATSINLFVELTDKDQKFTIPALNPLVIMHPLTEKNVVINTHLIDEKEKLKIFGVRRLILRRNGDPVDVYKKKKNLVDQIDRINCPFLNEKEK